MSAHHEISCLNNVCELLFNNEKITNDDIGAILRICQTTLDIRIKINKHLAEQEVLRNLNRQMTSAEQD